VSSGEPIDTFDMIDRILAAGGLEPVKKSISPKVAHAAGWAMEKTWSALGKTSEPAMTRWVANNLSTAHWFDISAARKDLGYEPQVGYDEGLEQVRRWLESESS
jgi:nucleoside-diphosphate-sugar epimerase